MDEAVADIHDGASILIPGFGAGAPINLLAALWRQGATDLTLISNTIGFTTEDEEQKSQADLLAAGRVRKVIASFTASTRPSVVGVAEELVRSGQVEAELLPQGTLAERIRAGGAGIPAFYTPTAVGTALAEGRETRVFEGREYLLERAIFADYALIRAYRADTAGNLLFRRSARNFNPIMATAARTVIVEVEQPIVEAGEIDPDRVHTPGIYVNRLVHIPVGGILRAERGSGIPVRQEEEPESSPRVPGRS